MVSLKNYLTDYSMEIKSPNKVILKEGYKTVFLAGSIEMGLATDWQNEIITTLKDKNIIFLNPRRENWDSSWEQKITNEQFKEQVTWELDSLDMSDIIVMVFDGATKSPISLLEFGLHAKSEKMIVYCPEPFWRKGNVDILCERFNIKQVNSLEEIIQMLIEI